MKKLVAMALSMLMALALVFGCAGSVKAQAKCTTIEDIWDSIKNATVKVAVIDADTKAPVEGAEVKIHAYDKKFLSGKEGKSVDLTATTGSDGVATFKVKALGIGDGMDVVTITSIKAKGYDDPVVKWKKNISFIDWDALLGCWNFADWSKYSKKTVELTKTAVAPTEGPAPTDDPAPTGSGEENPTPTGSIPTDTPSEPTPDAPTSEPGKTTCTIQFLSADGECVASYSVEVGTSISDTEARAKLARTGYMLSWDHAFVPVAISDATYKAVYTLIDNGQGQGGNPTQAPTQTPSQTPSQGGVDIPVVIDPSLLPTTAPTVTPTAVLVAEPTKKADDTTDIAAPETPLGDAESEDGKAEVVKTEDGKELVKTADGEFVEVDTVETPEGAGEVLDVDAMDVPQGAGETLAQTSTAPVELFYGIGAAFAVFGSAIIFITRRRF